MSKIEDGGPAFPNVPDGAGDKWADWDKGMTLRDYMAAKALQALITEPEWRDEDHGLTAQICGELAETMPAHDHYATAAYMLADAMLRARGVKE